MGEMLRTVPSLPQIASGLVVVGTGTSIEGAAGLKYDSANVRFGIGTATPEEPLHVKGATPGLVFESTGYTTKAYFSGSGGSTAQFSINRKIDGTFSNANAAAAAMNFVGVNGDSYITFFTSPINNSTIVQRLKIDKDGNVLVNGFTASTVGLTIKGAPSQSEPLLELTDSNGLAKSSFRSGGGILLPSGSDSIPSLAFTDETNTGFMLRSAGGYVDFVTQGTSRIEFSTLGITLGNNLQYMLSSDLTGIAPSAGLARYADGVVKVTDGSTGLGDIRVQKLIAQQAVGTPGTDEVQVYHDGTSGFVESKDGVLRFVAPFATGFGFYDAFNNRRVVSFGNAGTGTMFFETTSGSTGVYMAAETAIVQVASSGSFGWSPNSQAYSTPDTTLSRSSDAGVLATATPITADILTTKGPAGHIGNYITFKTSGDVIEAYIAPGGNALFNQISLSQITAANVLVNGRIRPGTLADVDATNNSIYYSTDAGKLVYKDSGGVVNNLY